MRLTTNYIYTSPINVTKHVIFILLDGRAHVFNNSGKMSNHSLAASSIIRVAGMSGDYTLMEHKAN